MTNQTYCRAETGLYSRIVSSIVLSLICTLTGITGIFAQTPAPQNYVLSLPRANFATAPDAPQLVLGSQFTLEAWVYRAQPFLFLPNQFGTIMGRAINGDPYHLYALRLTGDGRPHFTQSTGMAGTDRTIGSQTQLPLKQWVHVSATLDAGTMRLFVNGQQVATGVSVGPPANTGTRFQFGANSTVPFTWWCCDMQVSYMRQARVWNRALSAGELQTNLGVRMSGNENGLVAQWMMDDGTGEMIADSGPNDLDAVLGTTSSYDGTDAMWARSSVVDRNQYFNWEWTFRDHNEGVSPGDLIDFDSDGDLDFFHFQHLWPQGARAARAFRNNGQGVYTDDTATVLAGQSILTESVRFVYRDFTGDGKTDIFVGDSGPDVAPSSGGPYRILIQQPNGTLIDETASRLPVRSAYPHDVTAADIEGDGDTDIYVSNICCGSVGPELLINNGTGQFTANTLRLPAFVANRIRKYTSSEFIDINGDNKPELFLGEHPGMEIGQDETRDTILLNDGAGNFTQANSSVLPLRIGGQTFGVVSLVPGDFDNNGKVDMLASIVSENYGTAHFQLYLNNGNGTFRDGSDPLNPFFQSVQGDFYNPIAADLNGDSKIDIMTGTAARRNRVFLNSGNARFVDVSEILPARGFITGIAGDIDGDGDTDVVGPSCCNEFIVMRNQNPYRLPIRSFDFDGDGKTDLSIFRPNGAASEWWWLKSSTGGNGAVVFGSSTDTPVPSDYTGDGKTDVAFWRPSTGQWFVLRSEDFSFYAFPFGATGDVPVPADFDGDGKSDAAVFRESAATWFILRSSGGTDIVGFGAAGDKPVNADYDGDGKADIAIYRPSGAGGAEWWIRRSSNASVFALLFGTTGDRAAPGDFTGDGKTDVAFWRPANGQWNVLRSEDFSYYAFPFGANGDIPSPGDYDGDGRTDAAVFRPSSATWFANRSTAGTLIQQFGQTGDVPVPSAFVR